MTSEELELEAKVLELKLPRRAGETGLPVFQELLRTLRLVRHLTVRGLKVKYQRSVLGFIWTLLNPLLILATLTALFGSIVRMPIDNYWAFLLSGFFAWNFLQQTISSSSHVLAEHAQMLKGVRVHGEALVMGMVMARAVEFVIELTLVMLALIAFHHGGMPRSMMIVPVLILLQTIFAIGLVLPVAAISVYFDDVQHSLPPLLMVLFYISPVFYPVALVSEAVKPLYAWNPIARLLDMWHAVLYEATVPPLESVLSFALVAIATCTAGWLIFARHKRRFAEVL